MKTDTLWFRLALSAAAVWLAFWGYQSVAQYNEAKASELAYRNDPSRYDSCDASRLEPDPKVVEQYQHVMIHAVLARDGVINGMDWHCSR